MFNYAKLVKEYAGNQGYTLGLEGYHRLKGNNSLAKHYAKLASDFSSVTVKLKNRAEKNNYLIKRVILNEIHDFGVIQGRIDASEIFTPNFEK